MNGSSVGWQVIFGKIISFVETSTFLETLEKMKPVTQANPIKMHINGFGTFLVYFIIANVGSGAVVSLEQHGWLGMAKFFEDSVDREGLVVIVKQSS
jgi:hypothetical protein